MKLRNRKRKKPFKSSIEGIYLKRPSVAKVQSLSYLDSADGPVDSAESIRVMSEVLFYCICDEDGKSPEDIPNAEALAEELDSDEVQSLMDDLAQMMGKYQTQESGPTSG